MTLRVLSVCSGIGAPEVAWAHLGWQPYLMAEIEPFPRAVLKVRHGAEDVTHARDGRGPALWGDFTAIRQRYLRRLGLTLADVDVLVGGTPCQSFSQAGLRQSLADERGNLALAFVRLANAIDNVRRSAGRPPVWIVWENVPGVLSVADNAYGCFLGGLVGSDAALDLPVGRSWPNAGVADGPKRCAAWRVLDAVHFGLAQRRQRVFVVARGGDRDWAAADALLPVIESLRWHPAPRRGAGQEAAGSLAASAGGSDDNDAAAHRLVAYGGNRQSGARDVATALSAKGGVGRMDFATETLVTEVVGTLGADLRRGTPEQAATGLLLPIPFDTTQITSATNRSQPEAGAPCHTLAKGAHPPAIAYRTNAAGQVDAQGDRAAALTGMSDRTSQIVAFRARQDPDSGPVTHPLDTDGYSIGIQSGLTVRRLTPLECERLQGFPDGFTAIPYRGKPAADGPRYAAIGNSMAVPVMAYIGERIAEASGNAKGDEA